MSCKKDGLSNMSEFFICNNDQWAEDLPASLELVRLAVPRGVYTQSHFDYLLEVIGKVWDRRKEIPGYRITYQPNFLRRFFCFFEIVK